jgi:hypothetical protein
MASLPKQRLAPYTPAFNYSGCDFFGPIQVTIGRRREKRYGVLFTCLSTRAIHIELANSLDTDSCVLAIRNFINRRGPPHEIWSDNGTNFKAAEKELSVAFQAIDRQQLMNQVQSSFTPITWHFIQERMLCHAKDCFYKY